MAEPRKLSYVRWAHPVEVDGYGMTDKLDTRLDAETKQSKTPGVSLAWLPEERVVRVTTSAGESWISAACSMKPLYEDRRALTEKAPKPAKP